MGSTIEGHDAPSIPTNDRETKSLSIIIGVGCPSRCENLGGCDKSPLARQRSVVTHLFLFVNVLEMSVRLGLQECNM